MTMPVIRISEDTWKRLQSWAIPLEDSPDDALRRVLDAAEAQRQERAGGKVVPEPVPIQAAPAPPQRRKRRGRVQKLSQDAYRGPILAALRELGGSGSMAEVLDRVFEKVKGRLTEADRERLPSGTDVRWRNTAAWERFKMVEEGLLKSDSPRGTWELTESGAAAAEAEANE